MLSHFGIEEIDVNKSTDKTKRGLSSRQLWGRDAHSGLFLPPKCRDNKQRRGSLITDVAPIDRSGRFEMKFSTPNVNVGYT